MSFAVEIDGLTRRFGGLTAVSELSINVPEGEIFGIIGPNGAGKTTTFRILATLLRPSAGSARIFGEDVVRAPYSARKLLGYMPDSFGVYDDLKVWEYLDFFGAAYRIKKAKRLKMIEDVLSLTDLTSKRNDFVQGLSRGMKQRLCLAKTLIHEPRLMILDEPASGLDPRARIEFREFLKVLAGMGKTILISSHILTELADVCTSVAILERGSLVTTGRVETILEAIRPQPVILIKTAGDDERCNEYLEAKEEISETGRDEVRGYIRAVWAGDPDAIPSLLKELTLEGIRVVEFTREKADLEDAFMSLTKGEVQ